MLFFYFWRDRNFSINKRNPINLITSTFFNYLSQTKTVNLFVNKLRSSFTMPNDFNGKKIVVWLTENFNTHITKAKISNYSAILSLQSVLYSINQEFVFTTQDGVLSKIMFSPNFYDTDSEQYHKVMLQENLNGSYII